jgi:hypothetical protein
MTPPRTVGGHTARLNVDAPAHETPAAEAAIDANGPGSRTVGGTMRLAPGAPVHAPIADTAPMAAVPDPVPPTVGGNVAEGIAWLSPLPVAVGLVFFAVGSMITLAADGRFGGRAPASAASAPTVVATASAAPTVTATAAVHSAAPAVHSAAPTTTTSATAPAATATTRPHVAPQTPRSTAQPKGKPTRPALPF